jgi:hypothetical protein
VPFWTLVFSGNQKKSKFEKLSKLSNKSSHNPQPHAREAGCAGRYRAR